jgi:hypothetical protein
MKRNPRVVVRHLLETADTAEGAKGDLYTAEGNGKAQGWWWPWG